MKSTLSAVLPLVLIVLSAFSKASVPSSLETDNDCEYEYEYEDAVPLHAQASSVPFNAPAQCFGKEAFVDNVVRFKVSLLPVWPTFLVELSECQTISQSHIYELDTMIYSLAARLSMSKSGDLNCEVGRALQKFAVFLASDTEIFMAGFAEIYGPVEALLRAHALAATYPVFSMEGAVEAVREENARKTRALRDALNRLSVIYIDGNLQATRSQLSSFKRGVEDGLEHVERYGAGMYRITIQMLMEQVRVLIADAYYLRPTELAGYNPRLLRTAVLAGLLEDLGLPRTAERWE